MLPEYLPGLENRLLAVEIRMEENALRASKGMSTVGEETRPAVERLKVKYPDDNWLDSAEELAILDEQLDKEAGRMKALAKNAHLN